MGTAMASKQLRSREMNFNKLATITTLTGMAAFLTAPVYATPFCIAVAGGWPGGGTTFVGRNFVLPAVSSCEAFTGYAKTSATVVFTTYGVVCLSSDSTVLTFSLSSADPDYLGVGQLAVDYIRVCRPGSTHCTIGAGTDVGYDSGEADVITCPSNVTQLPAQHD
jgi:hypothetical protein